MQSFIFETSYKKSPVHFYIVKHIKIIISLQSHSQNCKLHPNLTRNGDVSMQFYFDDTQENNNSHRNALFGAVDELTHFEPFKLLDCR